MNEAETVEYDLDFKVVNVKLKNKQGVVETYTITELTGTDRDKQLSNMTKRVKMVNGQPTSMDFDGHQAQLLTLAMRDSNGIAVTVAQVQEWPARVQADLFKRVQAMSGLNIEADKKEGDNVKNS